MLARSTNPRHRIDNAKITNPQLEENSGIIVLTCLNGSLNLGLDEVRDDLGAGGVGGLTVRFKELGNIELGCLEDLGLSHVDVLQREDTLGSLLNLSTDRLGDELLNQLLQLALRLSLHDLSHLLSDLSDLGRLGVSSLLDLLSVLSGESDSEKSD